MLLENPYRTNARPLPAEWEDLPWVSDQGDAVAALLSQCPKHALTPLHHLPAIPDFPGGVELFLKDESQRMGLGSFKALGAAFAIAQRAETERAESQADWSEALEGQTFIAASAGNHGLSVAAGARVFGAKAIIVLSEAVPPAFADRLLGLGAEVVIQGADYAASMDHAQELAQKRGAFLLSDSSWPGYLDPAWQVMHGYSQLAQEAVALMPAPPTHIFLQAGVGGLAAACAAVFRRAWGDAPKITVVEPEAAPALQASIQAGQVVFADGPESSMGRLDCKEPSLLALKSLARDADSFLTISEDQAAKAVTWLGQGANLASTPSGVAGLAGMLAPEMTIEGQARILCIISEGAVS